MDAQQWSKLCGTRRKHHLADLDSMSAKDKSVLSVLAIATAILLIAMILSWSLMSLAMTVRTEA